MRGENSYRIETPFSNLYGYTWKNQKVREDQKRVRLSDGVISPQISAKSRVELGTWHRSACLPGKGVGEGSSQPRVPREVCCILVLKDKLGSPSKEDLCVVLTQQGTVPGGREMAQPKAQRLGRIQYIDGTDSGSAEGMIFRRQ